ncbi:neuron navigator 2-like isoform X3 [Anneissia japonica]|uniref:neuron navigator 2-like isoform X3 n=1 Tax=Anneissia japonica TaxID=1529436 RepID=UPI0014257CFC|nr:neuron navigator 2-like isoform X3 [Anneissia japonica]
MAVMLWKWEKNNQKIKKIYSDWANFYLERAGHQNFISDLQVDVCNGVLLARVIEAVIGEKLTVNSYPKTASQMIDNIEQCLYCLTVKGVNTQGLLAKDIKDGNLKSILGLFFALSRFKQLQQKTLQEKKENSEGGKNSNHRQAQTQPSKPTVPPRVSSVSTQQRASIPPIQPPKAIPGSHAASRKQTPDKSSHPRVTVTTAPSQTSRALSQHPKVTVLPSHHQQTEKEKIIDVKHPNQVSLSLSSSSGRRATTGKTRSPTGRSHVKVSAQIRIAPTVSSVSQASTNLKSSTDMASKIPTPKSAKSSQGSKIVPPSTNIRQMGKVVRSTPQPQAHSQGDDEDTGKLVENGSNIKPPVNINTIPSKKIPNPRSPTPTSRIVVNKVPAAMQQQQQQQNAKHNNSKNSMLTKLKFFAKENAGNKDKNHAKEKIDSIPKTPPSKLKTKDTKGKASVKDKCGREIPQRKVNSQSKGGFKTKSESNSSIGTTGSNTSSSSAMNSPTSSAGPIPGSGIQKKTGQKTIPRPVTGHKARDSPASQKRELEKPTVGRKADSRRSSNSSAFSDESYDTKSSISSPQTRVKKSSSRLPSPGQRTTSAGGKKLLLIKPKTNTSASSQGSSVPSQGRGIPRPAGSGIKTGLKPPVNYQTLPKKTTVTPAKVAHEQPVEGKEEEESVTRIPSRGGVYSTFPGPQKPRMQVKDMSMKETDDDANKSNDVQVHRIAPKSDIAPGSYSSLPRVTGPSTSYPGSPTPGSCHSPSRGVLERKPSCQNTATVAPFNYTGSRPSSKEFSEIGMHSPHTPESTPGTPCNISVSSGTSESSVIFRPLSDSEEVCTTYTNDKAVTTFGTPKAQRSQKIMAGCQTAGENLEMTVMNVTAETSIGSQSTMETTFDDNVITRLTSSPSKNQKSAQSSPQITKGTAHGGIKSSISPLLTDMNLLNTSSVLTQTDTMSAYINNTYPFRSNVNRFIPASSLSKLVSSPIRRTISNRSHLSDLQFSEQAILDECDDVINEDIASGYMSEGDILQPSQQLDMTSGYMSEGGGMMYTKRLLMSTNPYQDGMTAVRECLGQDLDLSDNDSIGDSSSISSGISDTIADISTDENFFSSPTHRRSRRDTKDTGVKTAGQGLAARHKEVNNNEDKDITVTKRQSDSGNIWRKPEGRFHGPRSPSESGDSEDFTFDERGGMMRSSAKNSGVRRNQKLGGQMCEANGTKPQRIKSITDKFEDGKSSSEKRSQLAMRQHAGIGKGQNFGYGRRNGSMAGSNNIGSRLAGVSKPQLTKPGQSAMREADAKSTSAMKAKITSPNAQQTKSFIKPNAPTGSQLVNSSTCKGMDKSNGHVPAISPVNASNNAITKSDTRARLVSSPAGPVTLSISAVGNQKIQTTIKSSDNNVPRSHSAQYVTNDQKEDPKSTNSHLTVASDSEAMMLKSSKRSPSILSVFGRGKASSESGRSSGINGQREEDTIISNPFASLNMSDKYIDPINEMHMRAGMHRGQHLPGTAYSSTPYSSSTLPIRGQAAKKHQSRGGQMNLMLRNGVLGPAPALQQHTDSGSIESLDSTNSNLSIMSKATSERYGLTSGISSLTRSNSIRSTLSEKILSRPMTLKELDESVWNRSNSLANVTDAPSSPTGSTISQPAMPSHYPYGQLGMVASMGRSSSISSSSGLGLRLRNGVMSLEDRQRQTLSVGSYNDPSNPTGSSLSLSSSSSIYTPEERSLLEMRRLKHELERSQDKVGNLTSQVHTNAHVVAAFEQSLSSMTNRLQKLSTTSEQKESELQELRTRIEHLKDQQSDREGTLRRHSSASRHNSTSSNLSRQQSSESISSIGSLNSMSSVGSAMTDTEIDKKKKKKNWIPSPTGEKQTEYRCSTLPAKLPKDFCVQPSSENTIDTNPDLSGKTKGLGQALTEIRSSFRSAFSRKKKTSGTTTDVEDYEGATTAVNNMGMKTSASTPAIFDLEQANETIDQLKKQLRERESKLTDVKLEALNSQHQVEQLRDQMSKLRNEVTTLKQENDRLARQMQGRRNLNTSPSQVSLSSGSSSTKRLSRESLDRQRLSFASDHSGSLDILLDDSSTTNGQRITIAVASGSFDDTKHPENNQDGTILIGSVGISTKTNWDALDSVVRRIFKEYILRIDPATNLGLSTESIHSYIVGEITRTKDSDPPMLLPCGYLVGDNTSITIQLKGVMQSSPDSLVFETLIPKPILQRYISLLMEHRRIILCGPSGTGKTFLAQKLAAHIVQRSGKEVTDSSIAVYNVDHKTSKELRQYLTNLAEQCESDSPDIAKVVILDNLHHVTSLSDVFNGFLSYKYQRCPYIIGTMSQASCSTTNLQLHHNFRWVLCANHMEPVKGFLGRYLRRKLVENEVGKNMHNNDLIRILDWIPKVWIHLNKFLETHSSSDVTIGPRLFLSCPVDIPGSQVWFTDLWNYSIVPYLLEAVREGLQLYGRKASWDDPSEWVVDSYPWTPNSSQEWPSLLRLRPEDVGFDGYREHIGTKGSQGTQSDVEGDPLLTMLMQLQEAANYSGPQSCDSDTSSLNSVGISNERLHDVAIESVL